MNIEHVIRVDFSGVGEVTAAAPLDKSLAVSPGVSPAVSPAVLLDVVDITSSALTRVVSVPAPASVVVPTSADDAVFFVSAISTEFIQI